jgi:DNA repair exonuclease SbcCD ATPase subunit
MFKLEYILRRGNSEYHNSYPDTGKENHNIFIFKGSNGLGKSTMMQILAMGMFGLNSEELSPEIKNKMKRLIAEDTKDFSFFFEISSIDKNIEINSSLKNKNIEEMRVLVNKAPCNKTAFSDQFQLIFDVPDEITKKLNSSLVVIKREIGEYIDYTKTYLKDIQSHYENISTYDNQTSRLRELETKLNEEETKLENYRQRMNSVTDNYEKLRKSYVVKKYNEGPDQINLLIEQINELEKRMDPKAKKAKQTKFSKAKQNFVDSLNDIKLIIKELEKSISENEFLKNLFNLDNRITKITEFKGPEDFSEFLFNKTLSLLVEMNHKLENDVRNKPTKNDKELEFLENIIDVLKKYVTVNPEIPGTNGKTLNQFLTDLESRKRLLSKELSEKQKFLNVKNKVYDLKNSFEDLRTTWKKIPSFEEDNQEDLDKMKERLNELESKHDDLYKKYLEIKDEYQTLSDEEKQIDYRSVNEDEYVATKSEFDKLKQKIEEVTNEIRITKTLLEENARTSTTPPKYTKNDLSHLDKIASNIQFKLNGWLQLFSNMSGANILDKSKTSSSDTPFYDALGKYLANILEVVFHEGRSWKLVKIDLIKETFNVENGYPFTFNDISTGFNALNSLLAKMKQEYGGRKKILLLDEIGIMDEKNINILLTEIKNQVREGKILFAALNLAERNMDHVMVEAIDV